MQVRLLQNHRFWLEGQEIGVDDETGNALIDEGIAESLQSSPPATDAPPAKTEPPARRGTKPAQSA